MSLSAKQMYPTSTEPDPEWANDKFKDSSFAGAFDGTPLDKILSNQQLALSDAIMADAGEVYNGVVDTPATSQIFKAMKKSLGNTPNLLQNHNFDRPGNPSQPTPDATPRSYAPGFEVFSGWFADDSAGVTNLTYVDGEINFTAGTLYQKVPKTGALEFLTDFNASVKSVDGPITTTGVSFSLAADVFTVVIDSTAVDVFSVKFQDGPIADAHVSENLNGIYGLTDSGAINIRTLANLGDGDDWSAVFNGLVKGDYYLPDGVYIVNNADIPREVTLSLAFGAVIKCTAGNTDIRGKINAVNQPSEWSAGGELKIHEYIIQVDTLGASADFDKIQKAIDFVPSNMWQRFKILIADGNYAEDLFCNGKHAQTTNIDPDGGISGEHSGIFITGNSANPENVRINSWLAVGCTGGTFTPQIASVQIDGVVEKTNEDCSAEFYGCTAGAVAACKFRATAAQGIMAYSSFISDEGNDFGNGLYTYGYTTKHTGIISINGVTSLGVSASSKGHFVKKIGRPISGFINASDVSGFSYGDVNPYNVYGVGAGVVNEQLTARSWGPMMHGDNPTPVHTYFNNLDEFESFVNGGTITKVLYEGLRMFATGAQTADMWMRRIGGISVKAINSPQMEKVGINFKAISGDHTCRIGIGGGIGQPKLHFKLDATNLYGVVDDGVGGITETIITAAADITNRWVVLTVDVRGFFGGAAEPGVFGKVKFHTIDRNFNVFSVDMNILTNAETNYDWYSSVGGTAGTSEMVLAELKLFRYPLVAAG